MGTVYRDARYNRPQTAIVVASNEDARVWNL